MQLRPARQDEWTACAAVYLTSGRATFSWVEPSVFDAGKIGAWIDAGEEIHVACEDGRILGFMSLQQADRYLHNLFVAPDAQGRGIGTSLLALAETLCGGPVDLKCDALNLSALTFYTRRGLEIVSEGVRDNGHTWFMMRRPG